mgnify:CR=1 FL=1
MEWQLKWGGYQAKLEGVAKRIGKELGGFSKRPDMFKDCEPYWNAFMQLCLTREINEAGACPIKVSEINSWLDLHGVSDTDRRITYYEAITALDVSWISYQRKELREQKELSKNG